MLIVIVVNEINCLDCLVAGLKFGNYPNYRGDSAKILLKPYNLEFSSLS